MIDLIWRSVPPQEHPPGQPSGVVRNTRAGRARLARLLRVYPDSSERLNDLTVRVRSLLANSAATGFINRIKPKSSPSAT